MNRLLSILLLVQDSGGTPSDPPVPASTPAGSGWTDMLLMAAGVFVIFYFIAWRPQAKERRQREEMLKGAKKGDRVMMTSGLLGTVAAINEREVVLKVDEKNNIRMRFTRNAIQSVVPDEKKDEAPLEET